MGTPVTLENVVVCYPNLVTPHAPPGTTNEKYGIEVILDPAIPSDQGSLKKLEEAFQQTLREAGKAQFASQMARPFKDGNRLNTQRTAQGKNPRPELENKWVLRANRAASMAPPGVADAQGQPLDGDKIFGGCICYVFVDLYWSANPTNPGVYCGLNGVQLFSDVNVTRIGGGGPSFAEMFKPIPGAPPRVAAPTVSTAPDEDPPWM